MDEVLYDVAAFDSSGADEVKEIQNDIHQIDMEIRELHIKIDQIETESREVKNVLERAIDITTEFLHFKTSAKEFK